MGTVSMNLIIMIGTNDVSISSMFTSLKGSELATYIQNRYSYYKFARHALLNVLLK